MHIEPNQHVFASSIATWATTNDKRDYKTLVKMMRKEGFVFSLWLVPLPHDADYEIKGYKPAVEGLQHLGTITP